MIGDTERLKEIRERDEEAQSVFMRFLLPQGEKDRHFLLAQLDARDKRIAELEAELAEARENTEAMKEWVDCHSAVEAERQRIIRILRALPKRLELIRLTDGPAEEIYSVRLDEAIKAIEDA